MIYPRHLALAVGLLAGLTACEVGSADEFGSADAGSAAAFERTALLEITSDEAVDVGFGQGVEIKVRLRNLEGEDIEGSTVMFALEGDAGGASLVDIELNTSAGRAGTLLNTGTGEADFRVRASAPGAEAVFISVRVRDVERSELRVSLDYAGLRAFSEQRLSLYQETTCERLLAPAAPLLEAGAEAIDGGVDLDDEPELPAPTEQIVLTGASRSARMSIQPRTTFALLVNALGPLGNPVARGCADISPLDAPSGTVDVTLVDLLAWLEGSYELTTGLTIEMSITRLAEALTTSLDTTLADATHPSAKRFLNSVESSLRAEGDDAGATAVALLRVDDAELESRLAALLAPTGAGMPAATEVLITEILDRGQALSVRAKLDAAGMADLDLSFVPLSLTAISTTGTQVLALGFGTDNLEPTVGGDIGGDFDEARSVLAIETLSIDLGLGAYGIALIRGLLGEKDSTLPSRLRDAAGCGTAQTWVAAEPSLALECGAECAKAACDLSVDAFLDDTLASLAGLDELHPNIGLRGEVEVHDANADGVIDYVEDAELEGSWGRADNQATADLVDAKLTGQPMEPLAAP